jgi:hypothetical protein
MLSCAPTSTSQRIWEAALALLAFVPIRLLETWHRRARAQTGACVLRPSLLRGCAVQRCGDAVAAGAFQALDGVLGLGPAGVATAAVPVCLAWVGVAHALGRRQEQLAAGMRRRMLDASA